jgi:hypothetical protein
MVSSTNFLFNNDPQANSEVRVEIQVSRTYLSRRRWLTPVILTTQEAEIRRITV